MSRVVIEHVVEHMEQWCAAQRDTGEEATVAIVASWASTLRGALQQPSLEQLAASALRRDAELSAMKASLQLLRATRDARRIVHNGARPQSFVRWLLVRPVGRFFLCWLSLITVVSALGAITASVWAIAEGAARITNSRLLGGVTRFLGLSFLMSALMYTLWHTRVVERLLASLKRLQEDD